MSTGFKSGMFGFKKTDVINYIEETHKKHAEKENELNSTIEQLNSKIKSLEEEIEALNGEKERLENIQQEYINRYNEVEKLSESIGRLYLAAQTNAKEIMDKSIENRELINKEVESNISAIEEMHTSLDEVKKEVMSSVSSFSEELDKLFSAFEEAKAKLTVNNEK